MAVPKIALLTRERDEARADAIRARVARDEARQERDAARQERDEAVRSQEFAEAEEAVMFRKAAALQRERDEARAAEKREQEQGLAETERANLLAEALHGSYGTEHRWREAYEQAVRERDELAASLAQARQDFIDCNADRERAVLFEEQFQRECDEARAAARDYLPHVKYSYDDLNRGKQYERAERERLSWLGPPETPLEECEP